LTGEQGTYPVTNVGEMENVEFIKKGNIWRRNVLSWRIGLKRDVAGKQNFSSYQVGEAASCFPGHSARAPFFPALPWLARQGLLFFPAVFFNAMSQVFQWSHWQKG
jgi:hypothetical protein